MGLIRSRPTAFACVLLASSVYLVPAATGARLTPADPPEAVAQSDPGLAAVSSLAAQATGEPDPRAIQGQGVTPGKSTGSAGATQKLDARNAITFPCACASCRLKTPAVTTPLAMPSSVDLGGAGVTGASTDVFPAAQSFSGDGAESVRPAPVPEVSTFTVLALGILGVSWARYRK